MPAVNLLQCSGPLRIDDAQNTSGDRSNCAEGSAAADALRAFRPHRRIIDLPSMTHSQERLKVLGRRMACPLPRDCCANRCHWT